jgi:GTP-binding protein HflX
MSQTAVIAARNDAVEPDTTEISALADAAGYALECELTQVRPPDANTNLGAGKVAELAEVCERVDADAAVLDVELTPRQTFEVGDRLPGHVDVFDRRRLILEIFAAQASTKRARLEIELARLRWELERRREAQRRGHVELTPLDKRTDTEGEYVREVKQQIDDVTQRLEACPDRLADRRDRRRDAGFDHVALAGYTNAGKSTLLHRLADDLDVHTDPTVTDDHASEAAPGRSPGDTQLAGDATADDPGQAALDDGSEPGQAAHADLDESTAAAADRLFKTLETTTRRATVDGRRLLVSDTVGFVADLPHDLVESFRTTLAEVRHADVVVVVVDATVDPDALRSRLTTANDVLGDVLTDSDDPGSSTPASSADAPSIVVALNKVDALDAQTGSGTTAGTRANPAGSTHGRLATVCDVVEDVLTPDSTPISVSALTGDGIDGLRETIVDALPSETAELDLPNADDGHRTLSWCYDRLAVETVDYGDRITATVTGHPTVVAKARARARTDAPESGE